MLVYFDVSNSIYYLIWNLKYMFCVYEIMRCVHKLEMKINDKNNWHYKILIKPKNQKYTKNSKK